MQDDKISRNVLTEFEEKMIKATAYDEEEKIYQLLDKRYIYQKVASIPKREHLMSKGTEKYTTEELGIMMDAFCYNYQHYGYYTRVVRTLSITTKYGGWVVLNIYIEERA